MHSRARCGLAHAPDREAWRCSLSWARRCARPSIARVVCAFIGFTLQRDLIYMAVSGIVLAVLPLSLAGGVAAL